MNVLPNCWEIIKCGREKGGAKIADDGVCIASTLEMGHSCWALAGTLCGSVVQGTYAQKIGDCQKCIVFMQYDRTSGTKGRAVKVIYPCEDTKYSALYIP